MGKISGYIISFLLLNSTGIAYLCAQDTIDFPLKIKAGIEVSGPALYFTDKKILNTEAYFSIDLSEKRSFIFAGGYLNYSYSQYNYQYKNNGIFARTGFDFNLMKPEKSVGKYWAGIGLHYGISRFTSEVPVFLQDHYWGTTESSISARTNWAHFVEVSPGVRAELFKNLSIGWNLSLRFLVYSGTGKDLRPIYFPGFGNGAKKVSSALSYFITWNIPYKKIKIIIKKEEPEEIEETDDLNPSGTRQQGTGIRQ